MGNLYECLHGVFVFFFIRAAALHQDDGKGDEAHYECKFFHGYRFLFYILFKNTYFDLLFYRMIDLRNFLVFVTVIFENANLHNFYRTEIIYFIDV